MLGKLARTGNTYKILQPKVSMEEDKLPWVWEEAGGKNEL